MSKHLLVPAAVKALIATAIPGATVKGISIEDAKPTRVGPLGMVIVGSGDPGDPEIDLSPSTWHWQRVIPIQICGYEAAGLSPRETAYAMMMTIGAAIDADRRLGGLTDWLEADAPTDAESDAMGAQPQLWADFAIVATYSTTSPLG